MIFLSARNIQRLCHSRVLPLKGMIASVRCLMVLVLRCFFVRYLLFWLFRIFLDEAQTQWSSAYANAKVCHARTPTEVHEVCRNCLTFRPFFRRQLLKVSLCQRSVIWCPTPEEGSCLKILAVSTCFWELACEGARVQGQPPGKEEDDRSSVVSGPLPVSKPAGVVPGQQHRRLRLQVKNLLFRDGDLEE